jgi:hypothetical protein
LAWWQLKHRPLQLWHNPGALRAPPLEHLHMNLSLRRTIALCTLASAACAPLAAHAAAFTNGSFELPGVSVPNVTAPGQAPTGWTAGGFLQSQSLFVQRNGDFGVTAKDGVVAMGFGGNGTSGATISQSFDTVAGSTYTVNFFTTAQQVGAGAQSYLAQALSAVGDVLASDSGGIPEIANNWLGHNLRFVASGSSSTLRFTDISNGTAAAGINWALDAVTVSGAVPNTVPEPGSVALVLTAGLLALRVRRS